MFLCIYVVEDGERTEVDRTEVVDRIDIQNTILKI